MNSRRALLAAAVAFAVPGWTPVHAQGYPDRPVKLIQGFAAGGNADTIARLVGAEMQKGLGQPVVVETMTGAGGTIASAAVARAAPDGHTLLLATAGHVVAAAMRAKPPYRPAADYAAISTITYFPFLLVTAADSKFTDLPRLLAAARAAPGTVQFGSAGVGTTHHLAGELLARVAAAPLVHVAYRGDAASVVGLLSGDVAFVIAPPTAVVGQLKAGKVRAIATTGPQRWPGLPDVPTVAEQGVAGYDVRSWAGLLAPAGTPRSLVDRLNAEVAKALQEPGVRQKLADIGGEARASTPDDMQSMLAAEYDKWSRLAADAGIPKE